MRNHLLIAGTGRAGTSFLVRYLTELGLDTHLSRQGDGSYWDAEANAGLEDIPLPGVDPGNLPYVIKTPWLVEFIDELIETPDLHIDAAIVPVRDLFEAAASRIILERRKFYECSPLLAGLKRGWDNWGTTPGGVVYSLNPLDQARILGVWFHNTVERLCRAGIPIVLLHFPRFITDWEYLYQSTRSVLPDTVTAGGARDAHSKIADRSKVRVGGELEGSSRPPEAARPPAEVDPSDVLDSISIRRELLRLRGELTKSQSIQKDLVKAIAVIQEKDSAIARLEAERRTFGAQVGRWLTRKRNWVAPPGSWRGRVVDRSIRTIRSLARKPGGDGNGVSQRHP